MESIPKGTDLLEYNGGKTNPKNIPKNSRNFDGKQLNGDWLTTLEQQAKKTPVRSLPREPEKETDNNNPPVVYIYALRTQWN